MATTFDGPTGLKTRRSDAVEETSTSLEVSPIRLVRDIGAGIVLGTSTIMIVGSNDYHAAGERFGRRLAPLSIIVAAVVYLRAWQRQKHRARAEPKLDDVFR